MPYKSLFSSCVETLGERPEVAQILGCGAHEATGHKGVLSLVTPCYPRSSGWIEHTFHYDRPSALTVCLDPSTSDHITGQFLPIIQFGQSGARRRVSHQLPPNHHSGSALKINGWMYKHYRNNPTNTRMRPKCLYQLSSIAASLKGWSRLAINTAFTEL